MWGRSRPHFLDNHEPVLNIAHHSTDGSGHHIEHQRSGPLTLCGNARDQDNPRHWYLLLRLGVFSVYVSARSTKIGANLVY